MPDRALVDLLRRQMSSGWETLQEALKGMTEEEFWWKPSEDAWTLRFVENRWTLDYDRPKPIPKAPLTIAWLIVHIATCKLMYVEYAFGPAQQTWDKIPIPSDLNSALACLEESHKRLAETLDSMTDNDLSTLRKTNWGELWPTEQIFWTLIHHDIYHGAQIQALRKLYHARHALRHHVD
jgi:hypothetical protein